MKTQMAETPALNVAKSEPYIRWLDKTPCLQEYHGSWQLILQTHVNQTPEDHHLNVIYPWNEWLEQNLESKLRFLENETHELHV